MSTTAAVFGVSVAIILVITVVTFLLWSSRVSSRRGETPAARYRREMETFTAPGIGMAPNAPYGATRCGQPGPRAP